VTADSGQRPRVTAIHHFAATVTDVEASAAWYERVLGLQRLPVTFPHHDAQESGYAVLLLEPSAGFGIALHHHAANVSEAADEARTGLDHLAMSVPNRADLDAWASWLDALDVPHSGVTVAAEPIPYSVLVFRDPDNLQLEFIYLVS
jgi:glyoxylase I family protein